MNQKGGMHSREQAFSLAQNRTANDQQRHLYTDLFSTYIPILE